MKNVEFGNYLKLVRLKKGIPQRKVASFLDVDTSTLSKIESGERQITINMIPGLSKILGIEFDELQIRYISEKILTDYQNQPLLREALKTTIKKLEKNAN